MPKYKVQMLNKHGDVTGISKRLVADDENQAIEKFISFVEGEQPHIIRKEAHKIRVIEGRVKQDFENPKLGEKAPQPHPINQIPTVTSSNIAGASQVANYGIVIGQVVTPQSPLTDIVDAAFSKGGYAKPISNKIDEARRIALSKLESNAIKLGANAVVSVKFDYEFIQGWANAGSMILLVASGTAVGITQANDHDNETDRVLSE